MSTRLSIILLIIVVSISITAGTAAANDSPATPAPSQSDGLQEIIVTAQKRADRLRDVPISITAATGEQLARLGITSPDDLQKIVPGFTYKVSVSGVPVYNVRGIGFDDFGMGSSPAVSLSVDQVPLPFLAMSPAAAMDIERVEVLKGPQGTLFGQNTTGGAINYIAAKPTADQRMGFDLTYGRFNEVDGDGYISGPITDELRYRVSAERETRDAWQTSETRPGDHRGTRRFTAGRVLLDWTPTDRLSFEFNANGWLDRSETQGEQFLAYRPSAVANSGPGTPGYPARLAMQNLAPAPPDARLADWDAGRDWHKNQSQRQFSARADWTANDRVTVTSISSYAKYTTYAPFDPDGTPFPNFVFIPRGRIETYSQELRAAVKVKDIKIIVGGNYEHDHSFDNPKGELSGSDQQQVGPLTYSDFATPADQKVKTSAAFASTDIPLTSTLTAQAGVRYTKQDRDFIGCLADAGDGALANTLAFLPVVLAGLPYDPAPPGGCVTFDSTFHRVKPAVIKSLNQHNVSWRVGPSWKPDTDTLIYASVTRGFKAGGFTPLPAVYFQQLAPVTQEQVTAYEVGVKEAFFGNRLDIAGALFYDNYLNKQLQGFLPFPIFGSQVASVNVPKSRVMGAELDISARPVRSLSLSGGVTYVETRVLSSFFVSDPVDPIPVDINGEAFPNTPRWQANANANYEFPVSSSLNASFGGDLNYRSSSTFTFGNNPFFQFKSYTLMGLRAGIGVPGDRWRLELWGKNVANVFYVTNVTRTDDAVGRISGMPATYGVTLRLRF